MNSHAARKKPQPDIELQIDDLALGGRGVARYDGRVVLVEGGYPGDRVRARVYRRRRNLWEAHAEEVLDPSPHREPPRCTHVGTCGGCTLQGLVYDRQLRAKCVFVEEALRRIGGYESPPMQLEISAPELFEYRNKMEFSFARDRDTDQLVCGLHYAGRFNRVFDLQECHLVPPAFSDVVRAARDLLRRRHVPAYDQRDHTGHARFLVVRRSEHSGELLVILVTTSADFALRAEFVSELRAAAPTITGIVHSIHDGRAQIATGQHTELWFGRAAMTERLGTLQFELSPGSFFQTNSRQAARLYELVAAVAECGGDETVLDLYCGTGTIGLSLAAGAARVQGVEENPEAVACAVTNAVTNGIANAHFECADVKAWLKQASEGLHAAGPLLVVVDPPRAGLHPDIPALITSARPRRIVYVSCNPATLARDVALLRSGGYRLESATPIDMFPHTPHIEVVTSFAPDS